MPTLRLILAVSLFAAWSSQAQTTNAPQKQLTLQECVELALKNNLELQLERISPQVARYQVSLAQAAYEPAFTGGYSYSQFNQPGGLNPDGTVSIGLDGSSQNWNIGVNGFTPWGTTYRVSLDPSLLDAGARTTNGFTQVNGNLNITLSQPLLQNFWIDQTRYNIRTSRKQVDISMYALQARMMDIITRVELAYYDLIAANEQVNVQDQAVRLAEKLLTENRKRVEVGAMAPLDEKQAEAQVASSRADLLSVQQLSATRDNELKALIAAEYSDWQLVTVVPKDRLLAVPQSFNVQASWMNGLVLRPDLTQARVYVERQGITIEYAKNQLYPRLDLVGRYGLSGLSRDYGGFFQQVGDGSFQSAGMGVQLNVPLGNTAARSNLRIAKAGKDQLLLQLKKQEQDVMVQIDNAVSSAKSSLERVSATARARDYAKLAYEAEQKKLENGKSTSFVVLQLQRDYTTSYASYIRALADYNRAVSLLAQAEGTTLEHHGMRFEAWSDGK